MPFTETAKFPSAIAQVGDLLNQKNKVPSQSSAITLAAGVTAGDLIFTVVAGMGSFLPTDNFVGSVDDEIVLVDSRSGDVLAINPSGRGYEGTSASTHAVGATFAARITAKAHNQLAAEVHAIETSLGVGLANVASVVLPSTQDTLPRFDATRKLVNSHITDSDSAGISIIGADAPTGKAGDLLLVSGSGDPGNGTGGDVIIKSGGGDTPGRTRFQDHSGADLLVLGAGPLAYAAFFANTPNISSTFYGGINLGDPSALSGFISFVGLNSGQARIAVADDAGTPADILLPTTTGNIGDVLKTNGLNPQQLSWSGVPAFRYSTDQSGLTAGVGPTVISSGLTFPITFRFNGCLSADVANSGSVVTMTLGWTDPSGTVQNIVISINCTTLGAASFADMTHLIRTKEFTDVTLLIGISGTPTYSYSVKLERMSE